MFDKNQLAEERALLARRLSGLETFLDSEEFIQIDSENQDYLLEQAHYMNMYLIILDKRIHFNNDRKSE